LGYHEGALEYNRKALAIREQVLLPTHPDLAQSYHNVGNTYLYLGDHEQALVYSLKALEILEQSLPAEHPHNVMCRSNIAITYAKMEDFIRASGYMDRALDSAERSMKGHPKLEMYRQRAQILKLCAAYQKRGEPLPFDNPFR
jgi:tetratricopeptide (TPR) repeat protein